MGMTVLQLVQEFCTRTGIGSPLLAVLSPSPQILQIVGLVNEGLEELCIKKKFSVLAREKIHVTTAAENQGALTTIVGESYDSILSETMWDRDERLPIFGPSNATDWQSQQALDNAAPRFTFRIRGGNLLIYPAPEAGKNIAFEYRSRYAVLDGDGSTLKARISADTDTFLFPDNIMLADIRWRWKREKGLTTSKKSAI